MESYKLKQIIVVVWILLFRRIRFRGISWIDCNTPFPQLFHNDLGVRIALVSQL